MVSGKKIFITGGAGFIGWATTRETVENNSVTIYDNFSRTNSIKRNKDNFANLNIINGDILDLEKLKSSLTGHDIIIHCAAIAGIDSVVKNPVSTMKTNMIGSANVLDASLNNDTTEQVICLSTSEVFGTNAKKVSEKEPALINPPDEPRWSYAASKNAEEHLAFAYMHQYQLPITILRPFNIYGPGQIGEGAIRNIVLKAIANEPIKITGNGKQKRTWCYIDDMVNAITLSLKTKESIGKTFNIGDENFSISIRDLAELIIKLSNSNSEIIEIPTRSAEIQERSPKTSAAKDLLGFETTVPLKNGIRKTIDWAREQNDPAL